MNDELVEAFVTEGRELIDQAAAALGALRGGGADADAFDELFRAFHTLKGSAGLMGFGPMGEVFHAAEDRLAEARPQAGRLDPSLVEALVAILDQTEIWLEETWAADAVPTAADDAAAALLEALKASGDDVDLAREAAAPSVHAVRAGKPSLRVEAERIDDLAAAADELVVLKNRLAELSAAVARDADPDLGRRLGRAQGELDRQVLRMHGAVTQLRVTPLAPVFRRFPRLVRETTAALGKSIDFTTSGGQVEVDKTVVDALFEPLLHLVRNALDHGVELPDERRAAGKAPLAQVSLSARTFGDQAIIEVADDGRGVDPSAVRRTAQARGLLGAEALDAMGDTEVVELIFQPGFSTAREVGDLSGRGVGLDAVRVAVAALGGQVRLASEVGRGARFSISLPLDVRLAKIMTVHAGGETFGVPLESIVETAVVGADRLTPVRAGRAFVWRDQAAPLVDLSALLRLPPQPPADELKVVIIQSGEDVVGVAVESFGERIESPLRPMSGLLAGASGIAGTTLTGDGRVLMVLDLPELTG